MPIKDANPELYQSLLDLGEDEKNRMCSWLQLDDRLFPPESEFVKLCISGGGDDAHNVNKLMEFDTTILFVNSLNRDRHSDMDNKESKCWRIPSAISFTKDLYQHLHQNLKALCEELGVPLTIQKSPSIDNAHDRITRKLRNSGLDAEPKSVYLPPSVLDEIIVTGNQYYRTRGDDKAREIIDEILKIEKNDCADEITKIELQIKLVEKLPIDEVELEIEGLIKDLDTTDYFELFTNVKKLVIDTCAAMRKHMTECTDLNETLDSLIAKVDSFEKEWECEYSRFFTSDD